MMRCGNQQRSLVVFTAGWLLLASANAFAADASADWKTECVGRFQVSLPGEVEMALLIPQALVKSDINNKYRFLDQTSAPRSDIRYQGTLGVSAGLNEGDFTQLRSDISQKKQKSKQYFLENDDPSTANSIRLFDIASVDTFAWRSKQTVDAYIYRSRHIFHYFVSGLSNESEHQSLLSAFINSFHPRPLYETPKGEGVCIPYGFIKDDGKPGRQIGVTMRLKAHPEVEIFFEDRSAADYGIKQTAQTQEKTEMSMLWDQQVRSSKKIDLAFLGYRSIKLDGRNGTGGFVEITQLDDSKDYGFAAVVNGDHTAKTDSPQLMMYVIRTASRAKGTPISKSELKDMAKKIAASIKRREVK